MKRENEVARLILDAAFDIHTATGPGLLESVYESLLFVELTNMGLKVIQQKSYPLLWREKPVRIAFRVDLLVEDCVIVEIKSIEEFHPVHFKQLLTYLKISNVNLGLLINFNKKLLKEGIRRMVHNL